MEFIAASGFGSYGHTNPDSRFHVSREGPDGEYNGTEIPSSMWMDSIKSADALRAAQIQADRRVMVSAI